MCQRAGHKLVVHGLIHQAVHILGLVIIDAKAAEPHDGQQIDLIADNPVFHLALVALKQHLSIAHKVVNDLAVAKAAQLGDEVEGNVIMTDRDDGLHAVRNDFINQAVIEFQTLLIWGLLNALGEDAAPGNAGAEALEAHLLEQSQILLVGVVKVNAVALGVVVAGVGVRRGLLDVGQRAAALLTEIGAVKMRVIAVNVRAGKPASIHIVGALNLAGRNGTAPEEVFRESGERFLHGFSPFNSCVLNL